MATGRRDTVSRTSSVVSEHAVTNLSDDRQVAFLNEVYDVHRICALNSDYYGWEVARITRINFIYEVSIAIFAALTAGSGVSHISFLDDEPWSGPLTAALAVISAILSGIKPSLTRYLKKRLDLFSKKYEEFRGLFSNYDSIVRDLRVEMSITDSMTRAWSESKRAYEAAQRTAPPISHEKKYDLLRSAILNKFPSGYYWRAGH